MRHREREGGSLAPRTWSGESHWAFVLPCRRRMPSRWSPSHATTYYAARTGRKWISSSSSCGSVSPRAAGKCRRREREISIWTKALHCGFADERKSLRGASVGSRYSSQTSLKGGILSSFEAELYSQIAVTVLNLCKKKSRLRFIQAIAG